MNRSVRDIMRKAGNDDLKEEERACSFFSLDIATQPAKLHATRVRNGPHRLLRRPRRPASGISQP